MKKLFCLLAILMPVMIFGQSNAERPSWLKGYFSEQPNSYIEVVSATGDSEDAARQKAADMIVERRSLATGQRSTVDVRDGNISVVNAHHELTVKARIVDQYTEYLGSGKYRVSLLVQTAKHPKFTYEPVNVTDKYGFSPRVFVPGMSQLHKGQTTKGALFITGEVAAVIGICAFEGMRSSYESKSKKTHNASEVKNYMNKADNMKNIRNGFIAGAAAIYVWNVIDGIVSKGKKHVEVGRTSMSFSPYADTESAGVYMAITF